MLPLNHWWLFRLILATEPNIYFVCYILSAHHLAGCMNIPSTPIVCPWGLRCLLLILHQFHNTFVLFSFCFVSHGSSRWSTSFYPLCASCCHLMPNEHRSYHGSIYTFPKAPLPLICFENQLSFTTATVFQKLWGNLLELLVVFCFFMFVKRLVLTLGFLKKTPLASWNNALGQSRKKGRFL